jgi:transcriptional regulator with XRE-family HTH domain
MAPRPLPELTAYRERHDPPLSRSALADIFGVSRATVSRWEAGKRSVDRVHVPKVSEITGIPPLELMGYPEAAE